MSVPFIPPGMDPSHDLSSRKRPQALHGRQAQQILDNVYQSVDRESWDAHLGPPVTDGEGLMPLGMRDPSAPVIIDHRDIPRAEAYPLRRDGVLVSEADLEKFWREQTYSPEYVKEYLRRERNIMEQPDVQFAREVAGYLARDTVESVLARDLNEDSITRSQLQKRQLETIIQRNELSVEQLGKERERVETEVRKWEDEKDNAMEEFLWFTDRIVRSAKLDQNALKLKIDILSTFVGWMNTQYTPPWDKKTFLRDVIEDRQDGNSWEQFITNNPVNIPDRRGPPFRIFQDNYWTALLAALDISKSTRPLDVQLRLERVVPSGKDLFHQFYSYVNVVLEILQRISSYNRPTDEQDLKTQFDQEYAMFVLTYSTIDKQILRDSLQSEFDQPLLDVLNRKYVLSKVIEFTGVDLSTITSILTWYVEYLGDPSRAIPDNVADQLEGIFQNPDQGPLGYDRSKVKVLVGSKFFLTQEKAQLKPGFLRLNFQQDGTLPTFYWEFSWKPEFYLGYLQILGELEKARGFLRLLDERREKLLKNVVEVKQVSMDYINTFDWALDPVNSGFLKFTASFQSAVNGSMDMLERYALERIYDKKGQIPTPVYDTAYRERVLRVLTEQKPLYTKFARMVAAYMSEVETTHPVRYSTTKQLNKIDGKLLDSLREFQLQYRVRYNETTGQLEGIIDPVDVTQMNQNSNETGLIQYAKRYRAGGLPVRPRQSVAQQSFLIYGGGIHAVFPSPYRYPY